MAEHDWHSRGFVHGAPGAMDCWDQRVFCHKCGTAAVLVNQSPRLAYPESAYDRNVGKRTDKDRDASIKALKIPEDCELMIVDEVHAR